MLQGKHSAILLSFIKLPFVLKIFVLSLFEWPLKTGFTVQCTYRLFSQKGLHHLTGATIQVANLVNYKCHPQENGKYCRTPQVLLSSFSALICSGIIYKYFDVP